MADRILFRIACPVRGPLLDVLPDFTVRVPEGVDISEVQHEAEKYIDRLTAMFLDSPYFTMGTVIGCQMNVTMDDWDPASLLDG